MFDWKLIQISAYKLNHLDYFIKLLNINNYFLLLPNSNKNDWQKWQINKIIKELN